MTAAKARTTKDGYVRPATLYGEDLGEHDGLPITDSSGTITGLEGGFSESASLDAIHVKVGEKVWLLVSAVADSHEYDKRTEKVKGEGKVKLEEFVETTVYRADYAFIVDPEAVQEIGAARIAQLQEARAEAEAKAKADRGEFQLPAPIGGEGTAGPGPEENPGD
jgi:hypothetical protein